MPGDVLASEPPLLCLLRVSCALCHGTALAMRSRFVGNEEEEREQSPVPRLRNDRPKNRSAPPARDDRPACGPHGALTDPGRTWRRQGQPGSPHSCRLGPPALLLHEGQLRGSTRRPLRGRLIRPREGRLARGDPAAARKLRVREPRHNLLGRDRGPAAHLCSQARSGASDGDALAHRRPRDPPGRCARHRIHRGWRGAWKLVRLLAGTARSRRRRDFCPPAQATKGRDSRLRILFP